MRRIVINTPKEFLDCKFGSYNEIVISPDVSLPFINPEFKDLCFEVRSDYPTKYRKRYLHPSLYRDLFPQDFSSKLDELRIYTKRGNIVRFSLSDNNLPFVCELLALCYQNCESENVHYLNVTNVPFPLKKSTQDKNHPWIWSCYWNDHKVTRPETEKEVNGLLNIQYPDFPDCNGREFPVNVISQNSEGVTGFEVEVGMGEIIVKPFSENAEVYVNDFPREYISGKHTTVKLSSNIYKEAYEVNVLKFIQFLSLYIYSYQNDGIAYKIRNKKLDVMKVVSGEKFFDMPYDFLFTNKQGNQFANFYDNIRKIIDPCLFPENCTLAERETMEAIVLDRNDDNSYKKIGPRLSFCLEKFQNMNIIFSSDALSNFKELTIINDNDDHRIDSLLNTFDKFKNIIISIIS